MTADQVLAVLSLLREAGVDVWVAGGWGVDALLGEETRPHRDLDLIHRHEHEPVLLAALSGAGSSQSLDHRPVRFVLSHPIGREIDCHPVAFAPDGSATQSAPDPDHPFRYPARCFITGAIGGVPVPCLSAKQQVYFHQGYEPAAHDRHDMAQLRRAFGIATHF
jgi:lincosamide nucleotidyltransferase A/C/D/E